MSWLLGAGLAGAIALGAYYARLLTAGGAWAAVLVGTSVFGVGGVWASLPMIAFFATSSLLPRALGRPHRPEQRTAAQVWANGLAPTLCCWGILLYPWRESAFWLGYCASLAAAAADTWATEFGTQFAKGARHLTTGKPVPKGTSGALSNEGTIGGLLGAFLIAAACWPIVGGPTRLFITAGLGFGGMLLDSLLGATLQARFACPSCRKEGERRICCGVLATPVRGLSWVDNNAVNLLSTLCVAAVGVWVG